VEHEDVAGEVDRVAVEKSAEHGQRFVQAPTARARIDAAHLQLVRVVTPETDAEHESAGREQRERRDLARDDYGMAQREQVHRGVHRQARRHRQRGRLDEAVVAAATTKADVVADAEVIEVGGLGRGDERAQTSGVGLEARVRRPDTDAHHGHPFGSFGSPSTRSATMLRWISLAPP
jgi:hypothetical protein